VNGDQPSTAPALVTGASGFIGRHLVRSLLEQNRPVFALSRRPATLEDFRNPLLRVLQGDLNDPASYAGALDHNTTVFHLASLRSRPGRRSEEFRTANETGSLSLGRAALTARVRKFVYTSTALVFGPSAEEPLDETGGPGRAIPNDHYLASKSSALLRINRLVEDGLPLTTLCPTIVFGPDHPAYPNKITSHIRRLLRTKIDVLVGGGLQRRNLVFVDDVIRGILVAESCHRHGDMFILGGCDICPRDFNDMVFRIAGCKSRARLSIPAFAAYIAARGIDCLLGNERGSGYGSVIKTLISSWQYSFQKAKKVLGYEPTPLQDGLQRTIDFVNNRNE
jgi:dihydroflavonol-4-reductase